MARPTVHPSSKRAKTRVESGVFRVGQSGCLQSGESVPTTRNASCDGQVCVSVRGAMATRLYPRAGQGPLSASGGRGVDETIFQAKLNELMSQIETLPEGERDRIKQLAAETRQRHENIKKSVNTLQESLDFLRLWIKYLLFDLEATRRENAYLRKMLEQEPGKGSEETGQ